MVRKIPKWLKNKYTIALIVFLVWIIFFDRNDLITQAGYISRLHDLRNQKVYLKGQIDSTDMQLQQLESNPAKLKKFAREKYLMKKKGEEVFVIQQQKKEN